MEKIKHLEIILKTVERCNINCTYCYFFNGIDQSYLKHPPYISKETIDNVAQFIKQACIDFSIQSVRIDFHGGEPLMQKIPDFSAMCKKFSEILNPVTQLSFAIQTNGMLINEKWLDILSQYKVSVGISLDGPKEYNDIFRLDKRGKGTYDKVIAGINQINEYTKAGLIDLPGVLCVINPQYSAKIIYRHFVDDLQFRNIDFLLPDLTYDAIETRTDFSAHHYGSFLCDLFAEWTKDDDPGIYIRILDSTMSLLIGGESALYSYGTQNHQFVAMTITSDGRLAPDDTLRSANPEYMITHLNAKNNTLRQFLNHPTIKFLNRIADQVPLECETCEWMKICRGGALINRYSTQNLFTKKSIMCEGLKKIFNKVSNYLQDQGIADKIKIAI